MQVSDHLIEQFFSGGGTEEERRLVTRYLRDNPEKLAQYLTEQSWESFQPDDRQEVPTHQMRQSIENRVGRTPVRKMWYNRVAVAAVVFSIFLIPFFYRTTDKRNGDRPKAGVDAMSVLAGAKMVNREDKNAGLHPLASVANESSKIKMFFLPDGSRVELCGHSSVSFSNPFIDNRRDIYLTGDAIFKVMRDRSKPFSVHSRGIVTTALGTVFRVNSSNRRFTTVRLYRGRVVVKKEKGNPGRSFGDVYLEPGQLLRLNNEIFSVDVETVKRVPVKPAKPMRLQIMKFSRQSLTEVFSQLQSQYQVKISFDSTEMRNLEFTGSFDGNKESLESFLNTLCILNELELKKTGDRFSIQVEQRP